MVRTRVRVRVRVCLRVCIRADVSYTLEARNSNITE